MHVFAPAGYNSLNYHIAGNRSGREVLSSGGLIVLTLGCRHFSFSCLGYGVASPTGIAV